MKVAIQFADRCEHEEAQAFYALCGYGGAAIAPSDTVLLARKESSIAGIVRLCPSHDFLWLRGMQVHPEKRRMGIGAAMLKTLEEAMAGSTTYCLPYAHLERFYGAAGFIRCPIDAMPQHLGERLAAQQNAGLSVTGMRRARGD